MDDERLIEVVLSNRANQIILQRLPMFGLPDAWLVAGSVIQTAWNVLTGRAPDYGIKDYDIFYFDADTSWEAEDANIRRVAAAVSGTGVSVEVRNQARVHLWYPHKFGIRPVQGNYDIYAPHGLEDLSTLTIRPNLCPNFSAHLYEAKAAAWKARWPELTVLPCYRLAQPS